MRTRKGAKAPATKYPQHPGDDLRSAYEHLGRVEIIEGALAGSPFVDVAALANLAQQQLGSGHARNAAHLLRSAEHLCFASLAPAQVTDALVGADLKSSISAEFEALMQRAEQRWTDDAEEISREVIARLFADIVAQARRAFARGAFRPALELARAAESLSDVGEGLPAAIPEPGLIGRLAS